MNTILQTQIKAAPSSSFTPTHTGLLQRKCSSDECAERRKKQLTLQRSSTNQAELSKVPPVVHEVLRSPGKPLDSETRAFMEPRFGHDFSKVRVHTDEKAAESARAVNARAYTVGHDIAFGEGQYVQWATEGKKLISHELTHVMQQAMVSGGEASNAEVEMEARQAGQEILADNKPRITTKISAGKIQYEENKNPLDEKAKVIIAMARDEKTKIEDRAKGVVNSIIRQYYPAEKSKVDSVEYDDKKSGDGVLAHQKFTPSSKPEESTGIVYVGKKFLEQVDDRHFARRVLQVGHELEHINQWRTGLAGGHKSSEREFLAFYHEALLPEKPGTGRIQHSTRLRLIDAALGNYYCLSADKQKDYKDKNKELLDRRTAEIDSGGKPDTPDAPIKCKESS